MVIKNELNYNIYFKEVCPNCKSKDFFEVRRGSDGLFSFSSFSHYKCSDCQNEFKFSKFIQVLDRDTVKNIVQRGIDGDLNLKELVVEFDKLHIYLSSFSKKKVEKKK